MKKIVLLIMITAVLALTASGQGKSTKAVSDALEKMEHQAWDAFGKGNGKFFDGFFISDGMVIDGMGISGKADVVKGISTKPCELKGYSFNNFKVTMLDAATAIVTYGATQDAACGGQKVPDKMFCSSIYVKRSGRWMGAMHQETYAM